MRRILLHYGMALAAAICATGIPATAQETPFVPPVNYNEVATTISPYGTPYLSSDCVTFNANTDSGSGSRWKSETSSQASGPVFKWEYQNQYDNTDDWLFLPDTQLEAAQYDVTFKCWQYQTDLERFAMTFGKGKDTGAHTGTDKVDVCDITMNGAPYSTPQQKSFRVTIPEAGIWNLGLQSLSRRNAWYFYISELTVTKVDPTAPDDAILSVTTDGLTATVTVQFPTKDVSGNDIAAGAAMSALISIADTDMTATVTGTPGSSTSADFTFQKASTYKATCTVSYTDADGLHTSGTSLSDDFSVSKPLPPFISDGYTFIPDNDEGLWATFVNANGDANTFYYNPKTSGEHIPIGLNPADDEGLWVYEYPQTGAADDWLILPVWEGSATGALKITYGVATYYSALSDYDVCLATSNDIAALGANVIYSENDLQTGHNPASRELYASVEPGTQYYIAFHLRTPQRENQNSNWYTGFFRVHSESIDGTIPGEAIISDVTNDYTHAGLSFSITLPSKDVIGNDLPAETIYADLYMTGAEAPEQLSGLPGTTIEKSYTGLSIGEIYEFRVHTYKLVDGEKAGDRVATRQAKVEIDETYTFNAPATFDLRDQTTFNTCRIINANDDDKRFSYSSNGAEIRYNSTLAMDDWMITKGIVVTDADQLYELFLTFSSGSVNYPETCELYWSTGLTDEQKAEIQAIKDQIDALDPESDNYIYQKGELEKTLQTTENNAWIAAMTNKVIRETEPSQKMTTYVTRPFRFEAPCTVFLGIHGCSEKDQLTLTVQAAGLRLHETDADDPDAVTGLAAEGKVSGALMADVTFTMPLNTFGKLVEVEPEEPGQEPVEGEGPVITEPVYERVTSPLNPDLDLVAVVKSAVETKTVTGKPGQEVSVEIAAAAGVSEITVFVQSPEYSYIPEGVDPDTNGDGVVDDNDDNVAVTVPAGQSPKSTVEVFCGVHQPKAPVVSGQPVLADDNLGFTIAWEAVTECANEGETHLNPEGLVYRVYETIRGAEEPQLVAETSELNATVRLADDADKTMAMHIYTVKAFNGLESEESDAFAAIFGQPESLPMEDNFADGYAQGMFLVYGMGDYVDPATAGAPPTESNVVLSLEPDQDLYVELPKFSTDGVDKGYVEFTFHADATTAPVTVTIEANGDAEPTVLGTLEAAESDNGWKSVHFDYPAAMLGKKAVSVKCTTSIAAGQKFLLDSYIATNYDKVGIDNTSALAGASARGLEGAILLQGFAGHQVAVCTPDGRVVATVNAGDDAVTVPATTGIYVVAADGFAAKVAVK